MRACPSLYSIGMFSYFPMGNKRAKRKIPPQAEEALREALAMGAYKAYLLSDKAFAGADTCATAKTLATMIKKVK